MHWRLFYCKNKRLTVFRLNSKCHAHLQRDRSAEVWQTRCLKRHMTLRCQRDTRWKSTTISHNALLQWIKLTSSGKLMSFSSINHICVRWRLAESELIDCHQYDTRHLSVRWTWRTTYGAASISQNTVKTWCYRIKLLGTLLLHYYDIQTQCLADHCWNILWHCGYFEIL